MTFDEWMQRENYAPATRRATRCRIASMQLTPLPRVAERLRTSPHDLDAARRYWRYLETGARPLDDFDRVVGELLLAPRPRRKLHHPRVHEAQSFEARDWSELVDALRADRAPEAAVVLVIVATGLRIGDILRLRKESLGKALAGNSTDVVTIQKGGRTRRLPVEGARAEWQHLYDRWSDGATVAEWICPTSKYGPETPGGAYQRVRRHLQATAKSLKLSGRAHLHRLRRTVAVRALEATKDVHLVQQLLGHADIKATQVYTDELRSREVAALQQRLLGHGGSEDGSLPRPEAGDAQRPRPAATAPRQRPALR